MPITIPHRAAPLALAVFAMACGSSTDSADHKIADLEAPQFADKSVYEVDFNGL